jgi:hypothetical protein
VEGLSETWRRTSQEGVEQIISQTLRSVREVWQSYPHNVFRTLEGLGASLNLRRDELETITTASADSLVTDIETILVDLRESLSRSHHDTIIPSLRDAYDGVFDTALEIKGTLIK